MLPSLMIFLCDLAIMLSRAQSDVSDMPCKEIKQTHLPFVVDQLGSPEMVEFPELTLSVGEVDSNPALSAGLTEFCRHHQYAI